ncbi:ABC transporter ATP-binding protein [Alcaligenes faecalis]|uniref:ABC transporter ATP-binding protein n=1 Tax=Alcaligenes faecalis TaxID=511 RepID=UPI0005F971D4|nr:ABC transporter ATP-binding protein [Alcaligenes faecalis]ALO38699.1 ABC transporter ATP-binding protein [Alcaligenes faecalis]
MSKQDIEPLLALQDVVAGYGYLTALHGVSLHVQPGEVVAILGANGAGKSTTLRAISGLIRPTSGQITWKGQVISGRSPEHILKLGLAHCPEERHVWPEMTVEDNLDLGAYLIKSKTEVERRKGIAFHRFPRLKERYRQLAGTLSGGEQQMLAIARALMSEPELLILDEPSLGLSPKMALEVFQVVRDISEHGVSILVVEQNVHNALNVASRAYVLETGRVIAEKDSASMLKDPELLSAYLGG